MYQRISDWVAPGGTLLIVGHLDTPGAAGHGHDPDHDGQGHQPPRAASVTAAGITAVLDVARWDVVTCEEHTRTLANRDGRTVQLNDVVVRETSRG